MLNPVIFTSIETKNSEFEVNQIFGKINIKYVANEMKQIQQIFFS
jgi:hypothetical protein